MRQQVTNSGLGGTSTESNTGLITDSGQRAEINAVLVCEFDKEETVTVWCNTAAWAGGISHVIDPDPVTNTTGGITDP